MDMDNAAVFLAGTILYAIGLIVILVATIFANNLIHKYWKSFGWHFMTWLHQEPPRFMSTEEQTKVAPTLEPINSEQRKTK